MQLETVNALEAFVDFLWAKVLIPKGLHCFKHPKHCSHVSEHGLALCLVEYLIPPLELFCHFLKVLLPVIDIVDASFEQLNNGAVGVFGPQNLLPFGLVIFLLDNLTSTLSWLNVSLSFDLSSFAEVT